MAAVVEMPDPTLNVSQRLIKAFQASSSMPVSMDGRLSFGPDEPDDVGIGERECSRTWIFNRAVTIPASSLSATYVQPGAGQGTDIMVLTDVGYSMSMCRD